MVTNMISVTRSKLSILNRISFRAHSYYGWKCYSQYRPAWPRHLGGRVSYTSTPRKCDKTSFEGHTTLTEIKTTPEAWIKLRTPLLTNKISIEIHTDSSMEKRLNPLQYIYSSNESGSLLPYWNSRMTSSDDKTTFLHGDRLRRDNV